MSDIEQPVADPFLWSPPPLPPIATVSAPIDVPRAVYDSFGSTLEQRVATFTAALEAHRLSVGVPAPVEAPLVEAIARAGGMAALVILEPPPAPDALPAAPEPPREVARITVVERIGAAGKLREARALLKLGLPDADLSDTELLLRERWEASRLLPAEDPQLHAVIAALGLDPEQILAP